MNIFILDRDIETNVKYYYDKHVIKMILEYTQILSTVCRLNGIDMGYKKTHTKHPSIKWTLKSKSNYIYLKALTKALHEEWQYRFNHTKNHKSYDVMLTLPVPDIEDKGLTKFKAVMPDEYITDDIVKSYRDYYICEKSHLAEWTGRKAPSWFIKGQLL